MININTYMQDELENWRRWCLYLGASGATCKSLEHRYQSESDLDRVVKPKLEVRNFDAVDIEKQISSITFPKKERTLIINEYIWRRPYQRTCKELGITFKDYENRVMKSVNILENRLGKAIDNNKERVYIKEKLAELATFT